METLSSWQERRRNLEGDRDDFQVVGELEDERREITKAQARCDAICNKDSPILTFPIEIACLIFREAHSVMEVNRKDDQIKVHLTEIAISHVCRQWRSAAIGLPILWSSFYYHGPSATYATLSRFEIYLERSKLNPLELWLDFRQVIFDRELNVAVLDMALTVASRWRLVSIFSDGDSTSTSNLVRLKLKELHAPHLEHLALYPNLCFENGENLASRNIGPHIFTEGAPRLKSVWLDTSAPNLYLPPLSGVTTLRIENLMHSTDLVFSLDTLRAILTLPNLENLSMFQTLCESDDVMEGMLEGIPLIPMERLKHLRLSDNIAVFYLLKIVRAPLLETIMAENALISVGYDHHAQGAIYSFPSLTSLTLFDTTCESLDCLRNFMEMTSAVRHITIIHRYSTVIHGVLGNMRHPSNQNPFWPHLETLTVDFELEAFDTEIEKAFSVFLKSHQRRDAELTIRISDIQAVAWKGDADRKSGRKAIAWTISRSRHTMYATVAELCTIETFPLKEWYDPKPWPPGGDGVLGRRIDLEHSPLDRDLLGDQDSPDTLYEYDIPYVILK